MMPHDSRAWCSQASVQAGNSFTLNAHPACDPHTDECFVQHPCPRSLTPISDQACVSLLRPGQAGHGIAGKAGDMAMVEVSRATLPKAKIIQHSHSPCITPNFVVAKIDAFGFYEDGDHTDR